MANVKVEGSSSFSSSAGDSDEDAKTEASSISCIQRPENAVLSRVGKSFVAEDGIDVPGSSSSNLNKTFLDMGFDAKMIDKAIKHNESGEESDVLEALLACTADSENHSDFSESELSDSDDQAEIKVGVELPPCSDGVNSADEKRQYLLEMKFPVDDIDLALDKCCLPGEDATVPDLADFIFASQIAKRESHSYRDGFQCSTSYGSPNVADTDFSFASRIAKRESHSYRDGFQCSTSYGAPDVADRDWVDDNKCISRRLKMKEYEQFNASVGKKKKFTSDFSTEFEDEEFFSARKKKHKLSKSSLSKKSGSDYISEHEDDDFPYDLPITPMTGFGIPGISSIITRRKLPESVIGRPYFFYENVALTPKGEWERMSRFLYGIEPEYIDSKYFSACFRKRGYIHNSPINNRFRLQPEPPNTIQEALPYTKKWWPSWDQREKLHCISTSTASAKETERLHNRLVKSKGKPSLRDQEVVLCQCKKWNLVWVGLYKLAPLEPDEIEPILGFPKHHTRGGGVSRTDRFKALGNSFQVDTVGYLLSPLKDLFPYGMNVLSLFSGIGGAEVALHRLGIPLKNVVSVEICESSRRILQNWWADTSQKGNLIHIENVETVTYAQLEGITRNIGGYDLVIGGSPCNNLTGSNRCSRDGLNGEHSGLFFDYCRILHDVRTIMARSI